MADVKMSGPYTRIRFVQAIGLGGDQYDAVPPLSTQRAGEEWECSGDAVGVTVTRTRGAADVKRTLCPWVNVRDAQLDPAKKAGK